MGFHVEKDVMVPMRDGVTLATDLFLPDDGPTPVLLVRMGYNKNLFEKLSLNLLPSTLGFVEEGYAVVWQDCRGSFGSNGDYKPHVDDGVDGADTVAWIMEQPWCDGNIGSFGLSYLGFVQWATAAENPEGLKAIAPAATTTDYYLAPWYSAGGARSWATCLGWAHNMVVMFESYARRAGGGNLEALMQAAAMQMDPDPHLAKLPMIDQPALDGFPWWREWMEHPERDEFWLDVSPGENFGKITTPALQIVGWFDFFVEEATRSFVRMRADAATAEARDGQRLLIGPWDHLQQEAAYLERQFGASAHYAVTDIVGHHMRFFDQHLRGNAAALEGTAPVRIFVMGVDEWRDEPDWPLPDTQYTDYFLDGSGRANTAGGDGALITESPETDAADTYRYDPLQPVPTIGGRHGPVSIHTHYTAINQTGPMDQSVVEDREDVLCYTTPELDEPVEVTGHVQLVLHASSSALDTDFTGKLVDVFPDGRAFYLTDGILRSRYRNSLAEPELLQPERVYELAIDLGPTSNVFLAGHRIRLEVSSSNFPRFDRNTNTGGDIVNETAEDVAVATNRIFHGPQHPSRLVLPIIER